MSESEIDAILGGAVAAGSVPGVVAAVTDRRGVIYRRAFGFADAGARRELRTDAVFRVASMTKLLTSILVLQLRDRGLVVLDAPFARFYPEFRQPAVLQHFDPVTRQYRTESAASEITVRQLLTHTSGFGYWFLNPELRALTGTEPEYYNPPFLVCEPGNRFQYGISTDVLGQLVAPVAGLSLRDMLAQELFRPLGMVDTDYTLPQRVDRLVKVHTGLGATFVAAPNERQAEAPRGGGGLYSTAEDYLALLRMLLNDGRVGAGECLAPGTVQELTTNQLGTLAVAPQTSAAPERTADFGFMDGSQRFGLGVLIETRDRPGGRASGSYGWAGILNTYYWVDPAAGIAAVIYMQMSPFCAPACLELCAQFENGLYRHLGLRK